MKVEHGPKDPEEQRNFSFWWFVISAGLFVTAIWALLDESVVRRPWKKYERQFNQLELSKLEQAKKDEETRLKDASGTELEEIKTGLKKAEETKRSAAYKTAQKEFHKAEKAFKEKEQARAFAKADLDESYYVLDHARLKGAGAKELSSLHEHVADLETRFKSTDQALKEGDAVFKEAEANLKKLQEEGENLHKRQERLLAELEALDRKIEGVKSRNIEVKQVVVDGLGDFGRVDRCQTCHMGIDKAGFEDAPQPFTTHPKKDALFGAHPPEQFGCTACHHGNGRGLSSVFKAHAYEHKKHGDKEEIEYMEHWEEPMYRGAFMQSSCNDCHGNSYRIKEADVYTHGNRLFVELGCHGCHLVDGYENLKKVGPDLRRLSNKTNPEWLVAWLLNPTAYNPQTRMPNFRLKDEEAVAIASFLLDHSEKDYHFAEGYPGRGSSEAGKAVIDAVGCRGCHVVEESAREAYDAYRNKEFNDSAVRDHGPQLTRIAEKTNPEWIYNWLRNPRHFAPETRMPSLRLSDGEAKNAVSYLVSLAQPLPQDVALRAKMADPALIAQGEELIRKRGCYGCHNIAGFESGERIGPELTNFGTKDLNELFFGFTLDKDAPEKVEENWYDWTSHKLRKPNIYDTDRTEHLMPTFAWHNDQEIEALLVFLKSQDGVKAKAPWGIKRDQHFLDIDQGRRLVDFYSCNACHLIEDKGGTIRAFTKKDAAGTVIDALAPPTLKGVGGKIQPAWLFRFLHQPERVRPWLKVRMPSFNLSDEEFTALVRYFGALDKVDQPYLDLRALKLNPASVELGRQFFNQNQCTRCHVLGEVSPNLSDAELASKAPNLRLGLTRLRPDWIVSWLADPSSIVPGTRMPAFWDAATAGKLEEIAEYHKQLQTIENPDDRKAIEAEIAKAQKEREDSFKQIRAVRDYVLNLGR